jgi:hypothetical protein
MRARIGILVALLLSPIFLPLTSAVSAYTTSPLMHWDAGSTSSYSGSGTALNDLSGNGYNGTFSSTPGFGPNDGKVFGLFGSPPPYVTLGTINPNFTAGFSATFYVDFDQVESWERIIDFGSGQQNNNIVIARNGTTSQLHVEVFNGTSTLGSCDAQSIIIAGFHHYGVVLDGTDCYFYRDGSLWASVSKIDGSGATVTAFTAVPPTVSRSSNFIGKSNWASDSLFKGGIGEISIYNRGLTAREVYENFLAESFLCAAPYATTTYSGNIRYVKFIATLGCQWLFPSSVTSIDYLIVGGGGGGGGSADNGGGGGGAGGKAVTATSVSIPTNSVASIRIGMGGGGGAANANGSAGGATTLVINGTSYDAQGGSGGTGAPSGGSGQTGLSGGGGGNGSYSGGAQNWDGGGGGAGAGAAGATATDIAGTGATGGAGGSGIQSAISSNSSQWYGSGGGGGGTSPSNVAPASQTNGFGGLGGNSGVGGNGGIVSATKTQATAGADDTGAGGGGAGWGYTGISRTGGSGANGIIFIKFTLDLASISSISVTSSSGLDSVYRSDEIITVSVLFTQKVYVTGTPRIPIQGLTSKYLNYASGLDTTTITFTYQPVTGDQDLNGFEILANSLALNGGTIKDSSGQDVTLTHSAITAQLINAIDASLTASTSISISSNLIFQRASTVTATITQYGKVTFSVDGKRVATCIKIQTSNSPGAYVATCNLIPNVRGNRTLKVDFYQNGSASVTTSKTQSVFVYNRTGLR